MTGLSLRSEILNTFFELTSFNGIFVQLIEGEILGSDPFRPLSAKCPLTSPSPGLRVAAIMITVNAMTRNNDRKKDVPCFLHHNKMSTNYKKVGKLTKRKDVDQTEMRECPKGGFAGISIKVYEGLRGWSSRNVVFSGLCHPTHYWSRADWFKPLPGSVKVIQ